VSRAIPPPPPPHQTNPRLLLCLLTDQLTGVWGAATAIFLGNPPPRARAATDLTDDLLGHELLLLLVVADEEEASSTTHHRGCCLPPNKQRRQRRTALWGQSTTHLDALNFLYHMHRQSDSHGGPGSGSPGPDKARSGALLPLRGRGLLAAQAEDDAASPGGGRHGGLRRVLHLVRGMCEGPHALWRTCRANRGRWGARFLTVSGRRGVWVLGVRQLATVTGRSIDRLIGLVGWRGWRKSTG
jgi:hypothetical protein